jgi:hypothetical protein
MLLSGWHQIVMLFRLKVGLPLCVMHFISRSSASKAVLWRCGELSIVGAATLINST